MERLLRWTLDTILRVPLLFWACIIANLLGAVIGGWFWYGPLLVAAPFWAIPFIPDCPLAALVGSIALLGLRAGRRWSFFYALVAFGCMKYGAWTIAFWLRHWSAGGEIEPVAVMLFITHIGLFIEGLLFVPRIGLLALPLRLAVIGWYLLSIAIDYGLSSYAIANYGFPFHPPLTPFVPVDFVFWVATILTTLLGLGLLLFPRTEGAAATRTAAA